MKKLIAFVLCATMLIASLTLISCNKTLEYKDGYYYCSKNGVSYQLVSFEYYPVAIGKEYATLKDGLTETKLYEIQNAAPERWLATENGELFCAAGEKIPTLDEMNPDGIMICYESVATISLASITDAEDVDYVLNNFKNGDQVEYPVGDDKESFLKLRISSDKYPWLYYNLSYVEFVNDVCEYDYPDNIDSYEYRNVSDDVVVTVSYEFECRYAVSSDAEEEKYIDVAERSGTRYIKLKKSNGDGTFTRYVIYIFNDVESKEECVDIVVENYKSGSMTENALREFLGTPAVAEKVNVVEYNYGKYFIYDRASGKCVKTNELIHSYTEKTPATEVAE